MLLARFRPLWAPVFRTIRDRTNVFFASALYSEVCLKTDWNNDLW